MEIKANQNGPYLVPGTFKYTDADGNEQTTPGKMVALCRCGESKNKPFCDGTHNKAGFQGEEIVLTLEE